MPALFKTISAVPRRIRFIGIVISITGLFVWFATSYIPATTKSNLESILAKAGFPAVSIENISLRPYGLLATNIKLDESGFDGIESMRVGVNWASFITTGAISALEIKNIHISSQEGMESASTQNLAKNLLNLPEYPLSISGGIFDLTTMFGEIRITFDADIRVSSEKGRTVKAHVNADQFQLGFKSAWEGVIDESGKLDISGTVLDGRMNAGPLRISRFNGWLGISLDQHGYALQNQMEAGSATFMNVPLSNLTLVQEFTPSEGNLLFRASVSGMQDVLFTADMIRSAGKETFKSSLSGKNLGNLLDYAGEVTKTDKTIRDELLHVENFEAHFDFESEKRFVGGPLPFSVTLNTPDEKLVSGNVLFYPDTYDVRGSLETTNDMALALQDYFKIPSSSMKQNYIRLDGNARKILETKEQPASNPAN